MRGRLPDGGTDQVADAVSNAQPQRTADYEPQHGAMPLCVKWFE